MIKKYEEVGDKRDRPCFLCRKIIIRKYMYIHEHKLYCSECYKLVCHKEPTIDEVKQQMKEAKFQKNMVWHKDKRPWYGKMTRKEYDESQKT
ncbi:hypothetical protein LCGC14_2296940 [marine sediment metagenome]|uniref:Uncharacterized protein n=1 Tax=marine sediment metagenome TaxID=412755 RepID=A0A0F9F241_9ZZZZ